jgi:hypothetical protein
MAFYRVTIWLMDGTIKQGIREYKFANVEYATEHFLLLAKHALGEFKDLEAALLSDRSTAVIQYLRRNTGLKLPWSERMKDGNSG